MTRVGADAPATGDVCGWRQARACPWPGMAGRASARWPGSCDQGEVMTWYAVSGPPTGSAAPNSIYGEVPGERSRVLMGCRWPIRFNGAPERSATDGIGGRRIRGTVR
jgi:hypothetical protein